MRFLLITFLILKCCTASAVWAAESITVEEYKRKFDRGMARIQEAQELLKKNARHNRKVEQTLAKIRAAWQVELKQAPEEPETPVRAAKKSSGQDMNSILNETSKDRPSYKKLILYRSPNDYVSVKPFFKKAAGISLQVKW